MIVEDSPEDAELMVINLKNDGFVPDWTRVETEEDYLKQLENQPDLILADWSLPRFGGLRALELMKKKEMDIPFIIVSGSIGEEAAVDALRKGAWDYVLKDRMARLGEAVRHAMQDRRLREERLFVESELRHQKRILETILDALPVMVSFRDEQGRFRLVNRCWQQTLGWSQKETAKEDILAELYPDEKSRNRVIDFISASEGRWEDFRTRTRDGRVLHTTWTVVRLNDGSTVSIGIDVSEHRELEEQFRQAQKMEAVGRLASGVAHDFNNMLSIVTGYADLARTRLNAGDPLRHDLEEILRAAYKSANLVRQLMAFARRQPTEPKVLDLNLIIGGSEKMLRRLVGEDITLRFFPCTGIWKVKIDPSQTDQILANLAVNARDAIKGSGEIFIETFNYQITEEYCRQHQGIKPGNYVMVRFRDTGAGMSKEVLGRLFEPFFTTKEPGKGTGLGLSTVYGIVKQNDGHIEVKSEQGCGTTFTIYLPRNEEAEAIKDAREKEIECRGTETVLLVEDDTQILELCRRILHEKGYKVLIATGPDQALEICKSHQGPIHLLVTDVIMPGLNGKELREKIETLRSGIRVMYMSGYTADVMAQRGLCSQDEDFIQKPFSPAAFLTMIRRVLGRAD